MKKRSPLYPMRTLLEARNLSVNVFEKVSDTTPLKPAEMAKYANVAAYDADTFASTAKQFGFMNLVYGKGYVPVAAVCNILRKPQGNEEAEQYLTAFTKPDIYKTIINEYKGKAIPQAGLEIYLIRSQGFSDAGAKQCAKYFLDNAKFLGLINDENVFNIDAEIVITPQEEKQKKVKDVENGNGKGGKIKAQVQFTPKTDSLNGGSAGAGVSKTIPIFIQGKQFNWAVPIKMTETDWEQVSTQLKIHSLIK